MTAYLCNDMVFEFYHYINCGCITHFESVEKDPDSRLAVNARMLPPEEISDIPVRKFDGADTWKYLDGT